MTSPLRTASEWWHQLADIEDTVPYWVELSALWLVLTACNVWEAVQPPAHLSLAERVLWCALLPVVLPLHVLRLLLLFLAGRVLWVRQWWDDRQAPPPPPLRNPVTDLPDITAYTSPVVKGEQAGDGG